MMYFDQTLVSLFSEHSSFTRNVKSFNLDICCSGD